MLWFFVFFSLQTLAQSPFQGNWVRPCMNGVIQTQSFLKAVSISSDRYFQDGNCRKPFMSFVNEGTYTLGPGIIDFYFRNVWVTVHANQWVQDYNARSVCGLQNWQTGKPQKITGLRCAFFQPHKQVVVPRASEGRFGIWKIENGQLFFGLLEKDLPGTAPEKRPRLWDPRVYLRQP